MSVGRAPAEVIAQQFIDAFNRRDADGLIALADPAIDFRPTLLVGSRRVYRGHDGLRRWVEELRAASIQHTGRIREVRLLDERRFLILSEVLVDGEFVSKSAMLAERNPRGEVVEARAYLTDEELLTHIGVVPDQIAPS